jgi:hypothetical protein
LARPSRFDRRTGAKPAAEGSEDRIVFICAIAGPAGGIAASAVLAGQGLGGLTFDRFYGDGASASEVDLAKIPISDEGAKAEPAAGTRAEARGGKDGDRD